MSKKINMPCKNCGKETCGKEHGWHLKYNLDFCNWTCVSKFLEEFYRRFMCVNKRILVLEKLLFGKQKIAKEIIPGKFYGTVILTKSDIEQILGKKEMTAELEEDEPLGKRVIIKLGR